MKKLLTFISLLAATLISSCEGLETANDSKVNGASDVASIRPQPNGTILVTCTDGRNELRTEREINMGQVCLFPGYVLLVLTDIVAVDSDNPNQGCVLRKGTEIRTRAAIGFTLDGLTVIQSPTFVPRSEVACLARGIAIRDFRRNVRIVENGCNRSEVVSLPSISFPSTPCLPSNPSLPPNPSFPR